MKATKAQIFNYKSIGQICELEIYKKTTVLVGKSNVGKTNILKSIKTVFDNDKIRNFDRCSWIDEEQKLSSKVWFEFERKDRARLKNISTELNGKKGIVVSKFLDGKRAIELDPEYQVKYIEVPTNELKTYLTAIRRKTRKLIRNWESLERRANLSSNDLLVTNFNFIDTWINQEKTLNVQETGKIQTSLFTKFDKKLLKIKSQLDQKKYVDLDSRGVKISLSYLLKETRKSENYIKFRNQKVKSFNDKDILDLLPQLIYLESDENYKVEDKLYFEDIDTSSNEFVNLLLAISGVDVTPLINGNRRRREDAIDKINKKLKVNLAKYWNQENLIIEIKDDYDAFEGDEDEEGIDVKRFLEVDIKGSEGHRGSISEQGPGFQWFLWFVVNHMINIKNERDVILIMDEPGLHLHASAQYDLLDRFENTANSIQILYTTHSPYLIDKNHPHRVSSVGKSNGEEEKTRGTFVNNSPYHSSSGVAWEPIRSAIGLPIGASLFVGGHNLIVEGITDQIYIGAAIRAFIRTEVDTNFDLNKVSINFGGDELNTLALALFCNTESTSAKVLLDSDTFQRKITKLKKGDFQEEQIFVIGEVLGDIEKIIDIEHLFSDVFYHNAFIETYHNIDPLPIPKKDIPKSWDEVKSFKPAEYKSKWGRTKYYEHFFNKKYETDFSKIQVAKNISDKITLMSKEEVLRELNGFKTLLRKIWSSKPKW